MAPEAVAVVVEVAAWVDDRHAAAALWLRMHGLMGLLYCTRAAAATAATAAAAAAAAEYVNE